VAGSVTVYASNACGNSSTKSLKVKLNNGIASIDKSEDNLSLQNLTQGSVYPNPAQTECTVLFNAANQAKYTFEIADVIGKIIMQKDINANAGNNYIKFNIDNFARGVYLINIIDEGSNKKTLKLVKE
jgi:ankyrin repeat protein